MRELSIRQIRTALSRIEEILAREGEIVVTRHGRPVARVVPVLGRELPSHAELRGRMRRLTRASAEVIRAERDERG